MGIATFELDDSLGVASAELWPVAVAAVRWRAFRFIYAADAVVATFQFSFSNLKSQNLKSQISVLLLVLKTPSLVIIRRAHKNCRVCLVPLPRGPRDEVEVECELKFNTSMRMRMRM